MHMTMLAPFISSWQAHAPVMAQAAPRVFDELSVGAAILMTLVGMTLHWRLPGLRMAVEESIKDGKMTEEQARRKLRFYARCAPIATLAGVGVLIVVLFDLGG